MDTGFTPGFTAEATLYRSHNRYRSYSAPNAGGSATLSIVPALNDADRGRCTRCENKCSEQAAECTGYAAAGFAIALAGCAASGPFWPICAGIATGTYYTAIAGCGAKH